MPIAAPLFDYRYGIINKEKAKEAMFEQAEKDIKGLTWETVKI